MKSTSFSPLPFYQKLKQNSRFVRFLAQYYGYLLKEQGVSPTRKSYGEENPDKTFYVIGFACDTMGLFALVKLVLLHTAYALEKGYIPVVDMQNYKNQYSKEIDGNVWEYFFEQPCGYSLDDISNSKNLIYSKPFSRPNWKIASYFTTEDNGLRLSKKLRPIYQEYIRMNVSTKSYVENKYNHLIGDQNVLGVLCRGSDYTLKRPKYHSIQPTPSEVVEKAKQLMSAGAYEKVYLATEDAEILQLFQNEFQNSLITNNQRVYAATELEDAAYLSHVPDNSKIEVAYNYLASLYILSKCKGFIAGSTSGSIGAFLMSEGFDYHYFWSLGTYN